MLGQTQELQRIAFCLQSPHLPSDFTIYIYASPLCAHLLTKSDLNRKITLLLAFTSVIAATQSFARPRCKLRCTCKCEF